MAVSNAKLLPSLALILTAARALAAVHLPADQPITVDAQSMDGDLASNNLVFRKIRISQGAMSISADQGQGQGHAQNPGSKAANGPDFNNSLWTFRGNVKITVDEGLLTSDDAQINFADQQLSKAVVNGKPAAFEQHLAKTGKTAQGHADTIDYDARRGVVRLSKNAWLSDGQSEFRGESLKYNMLSQTIAADAVDQNSQRVHIVIPPPPSKP